MAEAVAALGLAGPVRFADVFADCLRGEGTELLNEALRPRWRRIGYPDWKSSLSALTSRIFEYRKEPEIRPAWTKTFPSWKALVAYAGMTLETAWISERRGEQRRWASMPERAYDDPGEDGEASLIDHWSLECHRREGDLVDRDRAFLLGILDALDQSNDVHRAQYLSYLRDVAEGRREIEEVKTLAAEFGISRFRLSRAVISPMHALIRAHPEFRR